MVIGYDAKRALYNSTGLGNYSRTLIAGVADCRQFGNSLHLYSPGKGRDELRAQVEGLPGTALSYPGTRAGRLLPALWRSRLVVGDMLRRGVEVYHGLSGELPSGLRKAGIDGVVTVHDLIFMIFPQYYKAADRAIYRRKFRHACREARRIIAISKRTAEDIVRLGGVDPGKISVVYQDCHPSFKDPAGDKAKAGAKARYGLHGRYILSVGTVEERKNIALAVRALPQLPRDVELVAVGRRTPYAEKVEKEAAALGVGGRFRILEGVPLADLPAVYQQAAAFVYPSRYEGFGIPIVEAAHSGLPIVACTGSCLEEAGGEGGYYVGPDDVPGMAEMLSRALDSPENPGRIALGWLNASRFDNHLAALNTIYEYHRAARLA